MEHKFNKIFFGSCFYNFQPSHDREDEEKPTDKIVV